MIFSISPFCAPEKPCACPATTPNDNRAAAATRRVTMPIELVLSRSGPPAARGGWPCGAYDVVGLHPSGRADRKAGFGARRELPRGRAVAAHDGGLCGGEVGLGEVALAAVGHRKLRIAV